MRGNELISKVMEVQTRGPFPVMQTNCVREVITTLGRLLAASDPTRLLDTIRGLVEEGHRENARLGNPFEVQLEPVPLGMTQDEVALRLKQTEEAFRRRCQLGGER